MIAEKCRMGLLALVCCIASGCMQRVCANDDIIELSYEQAKVILETLQRSLSVIQDEATKRGPQLPGACCNSPQDLLIANVSSCIQMVTSAVSEHDAIVVSEIESFESTFDTLTTEQCSRLESLLDEISIIDGVLIDSVSSGEGQICSKLMLMTSIVDTMQSLAINLTEDIQDSVDALLDAFDVLNIDGLIGDAIQLANIVIKLIEAA